MTCHDERVKEPWLLLAILGASAAHAEPLKVELVSATSTWQQKKRVDVTLKVTKHLEYRGDAQGDGLQLGLHPAPARS